MKGIDQKMKPLLIYDILKRETDENHPMTTGELVARLEALGIAAERKSIYEDIKSLNKFGYEVLTTRGRSNQYYVVDRVFDCAEIKILVDAIRASSFITENKTEQLINKIAGLAGCHQAEALKRDVVCIASVKHTNEGIFYAVDTISNCILDSKKCSFVYFDLNCNGERAYRKDGARYLVTPLALVFNDNNYYMLAYSEKHENVATYRVDRMDKVKAEGKNERRARWLKDFDLAKYRKQAFSMFNGTPREVTLLCDKSMTDIVTDKFGESVEMIDEGEKFKVKVKVQISPTFFGWCATAGGKIKVKAPIKVRRAYNAHLRKCLEA